MTKNICRNIQVGVDREEKRGRKRRISHIAAGKRKVLHDHIMSWAARQDYTTRRVAKIVLRQIAKVGTQSYLEQKIPGELERVLREIKSFFESIGSIYEDTR